MTVTQYYIVLFLRKYEKANKRAPHEKKKKNTQLCHVKSFCSFITLTDLWLFVTGRSKSMYIAISFSNFKILIVQSPQPILLELNQPSSSPLPWLGLPPSTASHSYPLLLSFPRTSASFWSAWIPERSYSVSRPQIILAATRSLYSFSVRS